MINTMEILPSPALQPFVHHFAYREFDTMGAELCRPLPAMPEFLVTFNLDTAPVSYGSPESGVVITDTSHAINAGIVISGLNNQFNGIIRFNGYYRLLSIRFSPSGFYRVFGAPANYFTNHIADGTAVFNNDIDCLYHQLQESPTVRHMVQCCERYLLRQLQHSKASDPYNCIQTVSGWLQQGAGTGVKALAGAANMSVKTFERKFTEQIGVGPKLFARIVRFNRAIAAKLHHPGQSWTAIAHAFGYFDQMHFIKEFKSFTGETPTSFLEKLPPPTENVVKSNL